MFLLLVARKSLRSSCPHSRGRVLSHGPHHEADGSFGFRGSSVSTGPGVAPGYPASAAEAGDGVTVPVCGVPLATPNR